MTSLLINLTLAGGAGILSTLSPCVLPILPIVLASAQSSHRFGSLGLALGLALAYTAVGVFIATVGSALGFNADYFHQLAALVLIVLGILLLSRNLQQKFATMTQELSSAGQGWMQHISNQGWMNQFALGAMLGLVWSPCVGPILGSAITLASQGEGVLQTTMVMLMFSLGACLPLLALSVMSRKLVQHMKIRLIGAGQIGKQLFACLLLVMGVLVLTGGDKLLEGYLVIHSPNWLSTLTTSL